MMMDWQINNLALMREPPRKEVVPYTALQVGRERSRSGSWNLLLIYCTKINEVGSCVE